MLSNLSAKTTCMHKLFLTTLWLLQVISV
jgi:hypothetical protein